MEYKAKHDRIILKETSVEQKSIGRIVIPDLEGNISETYLVVAVGPGTVNPLTKDFYPTQHEVGDVVYCKKAVMHELPEIEGEKYYSTRDNEPLAYILND